MWLEDRGFSSLQRLPEVGHPKIEVNDFEPFPQSNLSVLGVILLILLIRTWNMLKLSLNFHSKVLLGT